eukprot:4084242-Prymnesium_polylepis.1
MPDRESNRWAEGLRELVNTVRNSASPAHWRWAQSCTGAASSGRAFLRSSELRSVLRRANATGSISTAALRDILQSIAAGQQLPPWLGCDKQEKASKLLDSRTIALLLIRLSTSSQWITDLFSRYAVADEMSPDQWASFVKAEQLTLGDAQDEGSHF